MNRLNNRVLRMTILVAACGCSPCEEAAARARGRLEECGVRFVGYDVDLEAACSEKIAQRYACYSDCYDNASCEDILDAKSTFPPVHDCLEGCLSAFQ